MMKYLTIYLFVFLFVAATFGNICAQERKNQDDLSAYLPSLDGLDPEGLPQKADSGESLFACINGGAELYVKHGFSRAFFQTYKTENNKFLNFEIFEMKNADAAHSVFILKGGNSGKKIKIGNEAVLEDYYLLFRKGRFYVSLTGFDSEKETRDKLIAVAKAVEEKIESRAKKKSGP